MEATPTPTPDCYQGGYDEDDRPDCGHDACWQEWADARAEAVELGARQHRGAW